MTTDELTHTLFFLFGQLQRGPAKKISELSRGEMAALAYLTFEKNDLMPSELSEHFSLSTARVANILNGLERKGYIERIHGSEDRRRVYVHISEAGQSVVRRAHAEAMEDFRHLVDEMGAEDTAEMIRLIKKLIFITQGREVTIPDWKL